jgi:hypothetical protein
VTGVSTFKAKECADQALLACRWSTCRRLCGAASATKAACSAWVARWRAGRRRDGRVYRIAPPLPSTNGAAAARRAPIGATVPNDWRGDLQTLASASCYRRAAKTAAARRAPIGATAVGAAAAGAHATFACHQHPATSGWPPANATERHLPIKRRARPADSAFPELRRQCKALRTGIANLQLASHRWCHSQLDCRRARQPGAHIDECASRTFGTATYKRLRLRAATGEQPRPPPPRVSARSSDHHRPRLTCGGE